MALGGVCVLIPIVGPMVLLGWLITGFWGRQNESFAAFPPFDFAHFSKYFERGVWPFLVSLAVAAVFGVVLLPLGAIFTLPLMLVDGSSSAQDANSTGCVGGIAMMVMMLVWAVVIFGMMVVLAPLMLRASLTQDFAKSFDLRFVKQFLALTWKETVLTALFGMVVGTALTLVGMIAFCVGMYFAGVVNYFSWAHLQKQLYALYVRRGGEPITLSPKLFDAPPPVPAA